MKFREHEVNISIDSQIALRGTLCVPNKPKGMVIIAHASGSGHHAPRSRQVAAAMQRAGLATLLLDLLTPEEEKQDRWTHRLRGDIRLLGGRLVLTTIWLRRQPDVYDLPVGVYGAGTAAAAAVVASAHESDRIRALVSVGGRVDLVPSDEMREARAPMLIIVGGADVPVLAATRSTLPKLQCARQVEVITGAADLQEQAGALEEVVRAARDWFRWHVAGEQPAEETQMPARAVRAAGARAPIPRPFLGRTRV